MNKKLNKSIIKLLIAIMWIAFIFNSNYACHNLNDDRDIERDGIHENSTDNKISTEFDSTSEIIELRSDGVNHFQNTDGSISAIIRIRKTKREILNDYRENSHLEPRALFRWPDPDAGMYSERFPQFFNTYYSEEEDEYLWSSYSCDSFHYDQPGGFGGDYYYDCAIGRDYDDYDEYYRVQMIWDISSIPDDAKIIDTQIRFFIKNWQYDGFDEDFVYIDIHRCDTIGGEPRDVWEESGDNLCYCEAVFFEYTGREHENGYFALGRDADVDIENNLSKDWFAVGLKMHNPDNDRGIILDGDLTYLKIKYGRPGYWYGSESSDWTDTLNWENHEVPDAEMNVFIPPECSHYPDLGYCPDGANISRNLTIQPEAELLSTFGDGIVYINGNFDVEGIFQQSAKTLHIDSNVTVIGNWYSTGGEIIFCGDEWEDDDGSFQQDGECATYFFGDGERQTIKSSVDNHFGGIHIGKNNTNPFTLYLRSRIEAYGDIVFTNFSKSLDANGYMIRCSGNWDQGAGRFEHNNNTVKFSGDGNITGSTTFYNVIIASGIRTQHSEVFRVSGSIGLSISPGAVYDKQDKILKLGDGPGIPGNCTVLGTFITTGGMVTNSCDNYYSFEIEPGGRICAMNTTFEYMNRSGIHVNFGAFIGENTGDDSLDFDYCTFRNGDYRGTLLTLNNNEIFKIIRPVFPENTWSGNSNVRTTVRPGLVIFGDAEGEFKGEDFDDDVSDSYTSKGKIQWIPFITVTVINEIEDSILYDGVGYRSGSSFYSPAGEEHTISVPFIHREGFTEFRFSGWSDGNTEHTRNITPNNDITLLATYTLFNHSRGSDRFTYEELYTRNLSEALPESIYGEVSKRLYPGSGLSQIQVTSDHFSLMPAFPNPFNSCTNIRFRISGNKGTIKLKSWIVNVRGEMVKTFSEREYSRGWHNIEWNGSNDYGSPAKGGVYFFRIQSQYGIVKTLKIILLK
ncbi:hypothetical protein JXI42_03875 [bacterium]|nr:hypothetical protein [bacterium]